MNEFWIWLAMFGVGAFCIVGLALETGMHDICRAIDKNTAALADSRATPEQRDPTPKDSTPGGHI